MQWLVSHGSYAVLFLALVGTGLGFPLSEDVILLVAGVLAHRGVTSLALTAVVCAAGVLCGDVVLFLIAQRLGPSALARPLVARALASGRREKIEALLSQRRGAAVFVARLVPGLRMPVFVMSAALGMSLRRFVAWDALGLCISGPVVVGLGYLFSDQLDRVQRHVDRVEHAVLLLAIAAFAVYASVSTRRSRRAAS